MAQASGKVAGSFTPLIVFSLYSPLILILIFISIALIITITFKTEHNKI